MTFEAPIFEEEVQFEALTNDLSASYTASTNRSGIICRSRTWQHGDSMSLEITVVIIGAAGGTARRLAVTAGSGEVSFPGYRSV